MKESKHIECEIFDIEDQKLKQIQNLFKEVKTNEDCI